MLAINCLSSLGESRREGSQQRSGEQTSIICGTLSGWGVVAEMGGLLISTMQYDAAGGSKARFGGNENGPSGRLMAHKAGAFRWDGRLNLDAGD